ncbi:MAG: PilZ domain-containing protein [Mariprofundaceae bacterium]
MRLWGRERRGNRLLLTVEGVEANPRARRRHVRIRLDAPKPLVIERRGSRIEALIRDKSEQGLGVILPEGADDPSKMPTAGERVQCRWQSDGHAFLVEGIVRWVREHDGTIRAGIETKPDAAFREHFQSIFMREQRMVIGRLRALALPDWMQPGTA